MGRILIQHMIHRSLDADEAENGRAAVAHDVLELAATPTLSEPLEMMPGKCANNL